MSHKEETRNLQLEIDHLRRKLRRKQSMASPSSSKFELGEDSSYRSRSRIPPSESFSYKEEQYHKQRSKSSTHRSLGNDVMSRALCQISKSPFTQKINKAKLPRQFIQPTFTIYNEMTDLVEHINHFNQRMAVHLRIETFMCKVFPFNLGPVAVRWFDGLDEGSIGYFQELTRAFGARFVTCSRVPHPLDSLLSMVMRESETLKTYSNRYWETFNEIDGDFEDVAIRTFKVGLPTKHELRKSLTKKLAQCMHQLMDQIDKHKRVEDDQQ